MVFASPHLRRKGDAIMKYNRKRIVQAIQAHNAGFDADDWIIAQHFSGFLFAIEITPFFNAYAFLRCIKEEHGT